MKMLIPATAAALLAACATLPAEDATAPTAGRCDAEALGGLVGQVATASLGEEALRRSGARSLRWIQPGTVVTMDYREDRLNVHLDSANRIERFSCG